MSPARIASAASSSGESTTSSNAATVRSKTRLANGYGTVSVAAAAATASDGCGIVRDIDRLPVRVDIQRLGTRLAPPRARVALPAEGHVRLEPVGGAVDLHAAGDDSPDEFLAAVDAGRPDRGGQAVRTRVRDRE